HQNALMLDSWVRPCLEIFKITLPHSYQIEQAVQPQKRDRMTSGLSYDRLCSESDAHAGNSKHRQIVRPVAYGNHLLKRDVLLVGNLPQQSGLSCAVHNLGPDLPADFAVNNIQLIG